VFLNLSLLWVYFTFYSAPSITLPYPFTFHAPFFNSFQYTSLYPLLSQMLCFTVLLRHHHSLFLSLFSQGESLHSIVLVFVYMFIFCIYFSHMRENMQLLSFWTWLTSLNMMSSNCIYPFTFKPHAIILYGLVILHCIYIPQFLDPFFSGRAPGLFPKLVCCE
jgi:hypothetical protein